jgi:protein required for attachment to host cells
MRLNPEQIRQSSIIWILVANGEEAQVYRYHKDRAVMRMREARKHPHYEEKERHELTPVPGMELKAESLDIFQTGPDRRGSFIGGQNSAHNAPEPNLSIQDEVKQNLVTAIAAKLKQACTDKAFDHLVIAASSRILGALRQHLNADVLSRVIAEIPRDFTHDKNHALLAHLQNTLTEAHVT